MNELSLETFEAHVKDVLEKYCCFGSLAFCCGLEKRCTNRDTAMKELGISNDLFLKLKEEFNNKLINCLKNKL